MTLQQNPHGAGFTFNGKGLKNTSTIFCFGKKHPHFLQQKGRLPMDSVFSSWNYPKSIL
jgi:hypothetical protein